MRVHRAGRWFVVCGRQGRTFMLPGSSPVDLVFKVLDQLRGGMCGEEHVAVRERSAEAAIAIACNENLLDPV